MSQSPVMPRPDNRSEQWVIISELWYQWAINKGIAAYLSTCWVAPPKMI